MEGSVFGLHRGCWGFHLGLFFWFWQDIHKNWIVSQQDNQISWCMSHWNSQPLFLTRHLTINITICVHKFWASLFGSLFIPTSKNHRLPEYSLPWFLGCRQQGRFALRVILLPPSASLSVARWWTLGEGEHLIWQAQAWNPQGKMVESSRKSFPHGGMSLFSLEICFPAEILCPFLWHFQTLCIGALGKIKIWENLKSRFVDILWAMPSKQLQGHQFSVHWRTI